MISRLSSGARTSCWVHVPIFCQTSFAKEQCSIICPAVFCSWLQREHIGLQGHYRAINLSVVSNLHCTSSHAKNLCLPSASAFQIELPSRLYHLKSSSRAFSRSCNLACRTVFLGASCVAPGCVVWLHDRGLTPACYDESMAPYSKEHGSSFF